MSYITPPLSPKPYPYPAHSPTSSSTTAVSRSPSPPHSSRFTTKVFSFPTITFSPRINDYTDEKGLPGPSSAGHSRQSSLAGIGRMGMRKKRLIAQIAAAVGLMTLGMVWYGASLEGVSVDGWRKGISVADPAPILPGKVVGSNGEFHGLAPPAAPAIDPMTTWGLNLDSGKLLAGLNPWPPNPPFDPDTPPLSTLGQFADNIYNLGPLDLPSYKEMMYNFVDESFPTHLSQAIRSRMEGYLEEGQGGKMDDWDRVKKIWQTDKDRDQVGSREIGSWRDGAAAKEGWEWELMTDESADEWIDKLLKYSRMQQVWQALPTGILRSDTLRYLFLALEGGIYSDTDTALLKEPSRWGRGATIWRNGAGWLRDEERNRIEAGEEVDMVLGRASVVVGLEADVGEREDWFDWWPRPIQIVQWTLASAPYHPIALNALLRVTHSTAEAVEWSHKHARDIRNLNALGRYDDARSLMATSVFSDKAHGGSGGVMTWTGPGVWTDAVLSYLRVKHGLLWTDLRNIRQPLRIGDVLILPVTGFSPGVGNFGSKPSWHQEAMVEHRFRGSWKEKSG